VTLKGAHFGVLATTTLPLLCGGTLVFDSNGNFLHLALCGPSEKRRNQLLEYVAHLTRSGALQVAGATADNAKASIHAVVENGSARLFRIAAMRHGHHTQR